MLKAACCTYAVCRAWLLISFSGGTVSPGVNRSLGRPDVNMDAELLERARCEDRRHRERYQSPVSAENLRKTLGVGAERSRILVKLVRAERSNSK